MKSIFHSELYICCSISESVSSIEGSKSRRRRRRKSRQRNFPNGGAASGTETDNSVKGAEQRASSVPKSVVSDKKGVSNGSDTKVSSTNIELNNKKGNGSPKAQRESRNNMNNGKAVNGQ